MPHINFKKLEIFLLIVVILLGAFFYLYKLGSNPPGLYLDEVGTGYNAYSILKTGKDEYGKALPIAFRLFGSYTPPLYIYLSVPIMAIFDLSIFSTRLLSVICGLIDIPIIFFLIKELNITKHKWTPLIGTIFFAITPWTVFFSRMGYEQNLAFLFFTISVFLIVKSIKNPKILMFAIPALSLSTYTDYPQRLIAPILFFSTMFLFRKKFLIKSNFHYLKMGIIIAALFQIPNLLIFFTPSFLTKTSHFYLDTVLSQSIKIDHYLPSFISIPLSFFREFLSQFFTYFSPRSLFFLPDSDLQRSIPGLSVFYPWMIIPYLIGLFLTWKQRKNPSGKLIALLLLITPLPGALTRQPFHIQRTLTLLLPLTLVITIGIDKLISSYRKIIWLPVFLGLFSFSILFLWRSYFVLLPQERSTIWGFEYKMLADYIQKNPNKHFVIDQSTRTQPQDIAYTQLAFYLKLDPRIIQSEEINKGIAKNYYTNTTFSFIHSFENIETRNIEWGETVTKDEILVGDTTSISDLEVKRHNLTQVFEIKDPNNNIVLRGFQTHPTQKLNIQK